MAKTLLSLSEVTVHQTTRAFGRTLPYTRLIVVVDGQIPYSVAETVETAKFYAADAMKRDNTCEPVIFEISWPKA